MRSLSYYLQFGRGLGRLGFYARGFAGYYAPRGWFVSRREDVVGALSGEDLHRAERMAEYYCRLPEGAAVGEPGVTVGEFHYPYGEKHKFATYFFDLYGVVRYFPDELRFGYKFGDLREAPAGATFVKSRPIVGEGERSMATLLRLNALRHYRWVAPWEDVAFEEKKDMLVSRAVSVQPWRQKLLERWFGDERCDIGHTAKEPLREHPEWSKDFLSVAEHLKFKFIATVEGNDVATNLKWVMSSGSLAVMPRPKVESWFAEGLLRGNEEYVEVKDDFSDLMERLEFYASHPKEAKEIVEAAHRYVAPFRDERLQLATQILTARRYFELTGQEV